MNLNEAIRQLITLGEKEPQVIVEKLRSRHGDDWLLEQVKPHVDDFVANMAQHLLGAQRRQSERALSPGAPKAQSELMIRSVWIPEAGWVRAADLTVADLRAKAAWYERMAQVSAVRATWYSEVALLLERSGAPTLGELREELPSLPGSGNAFLDGLAAA